MQGRSNFAEPYLLGVSGGAAVRAVIAVAAGASSSVGVPIAAFAGAVVTTFVIELSPAPRRADERTSACCSWLASWSARSPTPRSPSVTAHHRRRNGARRTVVDDGICRFLDWSRVRWLAPYVILGGGALLAWSREIDAMALGDEAAAGLGVDVQSAGRRTFLAAGLLAAATVAAAGLVGFVGLVVPHIVRGAGLRRHRLLIAGAAVVGGALVGGADVVARVARPPAELPLGAPSLRSSGCPFSSGSSGGWATRATAAPSRGREPGSWP